MTRGREDTTVASDSPGGRRPLVSIVVPVFNGAKYLRESLDSIVAQTYPDIEILVMDDASTDETPEIIASYGARVKCFRQPSNLSIYENANVGIARARGEFVAVYHADDVYVPTIVERQCACLERHPEVGAVFCKDIFIDAEGHEVARLRLPPEVSGGRPLSYTVVLNALLTHKNPFLRCPSAMVRAAVHRDVGMYRSTEFLNTSDLEMWLRIARKYPLVIVDEHLFRYRFGHGQSSQRYHYLRTDQNRYFRIMDLYLAEGGRELATAEAIAAYEAHRAEDRLTRSVNHYILGQRPEARDLLGRVRAGQIAGSPRVQRWRLLVLFALLLVLVRLPRLSFMAGLFHRRWQSKRVPS